LIFFDQNPANHDKEISGTTAAGDQINTLLAAAAYNING
jgi:hypothetical protein